MGIYWATYLCIGKFVNQTIARIVDKIQVASLNPIITRQEWKAGRVALSEIEKYKTQWGINIKETDEDTDLFLEQGESTTYDYPPSSTSKFILVARGQTFVRTPGEGAST